MILLSEHMTKQRAPDSSEELNKLDPIDLKVLIWLVEHKMSSVPGWIQYVTSEYKKKGITINQDRLAAEAENLNCN